MTPLPAIDVRPRIARLLERLGDDRIGFVTRPENVRYLTGFCGSNGAVLVGAGHHALFTDRRYGDRAVDELDAVSSEAEITVVSALVDELDARVAVDERLLVELDDLSWTRVETMRARLGTRLGTDAALTVDRSVKDPAEIERIRRAARIADDALASVVASTSLRRRERDLAELLESAMRERGADGVGYPPIVASGPQNSARPHHAPGDRMVVDGDIVLIDVGAEVDGYRSDMTRTFLVGDVADEALRWVELAQAAHDAGFDAVVAGATAEEVDAAARQVAVDAGESDAFLHPVGHGVGLVIHEEPAVRPGSRVTLAPGHVITVEPGVYRPGRGGARIEDTVVVADPDSAIAAERLTRSPTTPQVE